MNPEDVRTKLAAAGAPGIISIEPFEGVAARVKFDPTAATALFPIVRDALGFPHLSMVGGIDWVERYEVFYLVWSDPAKTYLLLSADLDAKAPHIETASACWPSANWHEREAWELVGIQFDHHPDLRHLLMPDGYQFHPLQRAFKLHEPEDLEVKVRHV
ncbi:MAG: NADH-quinone oxidoreductase subunit C [Thermoplasmata archaeon]|nr:NADH-quinone oxidoreductase subunit C [Thermoplasmata archaeon]